MKQNRLKYVILGSLCALIMTMAVGYAAFSSILKINGTTSITSNWDIKIISVTKANQTGSAEEAKAPTWTDLTAYMEANLYEKGDSIEYNVIVKNNGTIDAKLDNITENVKSQNEAVKISFSGYTKGEKLLKGNSQTITVKIEYNPDFTGTVTEGSTETSVEFSYVQAEGGAVVPGGDDSETAADKLIALETTSGDGLYADTYEPGRYVYKGANPDNYITFNNETWRIVSVETDNTIKIMKKDSIGNQTFDSSPSNNWARPADLNTYLNDDTEGASSYYNNSLSDDAKGLIQKHSWGIGAIALNNKDLAAQITSENGTTWTGNIGLISVSDFLRANTNATQCGNYSLNNTNKATCKTTNYLVPASGVLWTISPRDQTYFGYEFFIQSGGDVGAIRVNVNTISVYPAVYLTSNISLEGKGTSTEPYTIIAN